MAKKPQLPIVRLAPGRQKRVADGHPWVYANEVAKIDGDFVPGDYVEVRDSRNVLVGKGYVNPRSQIIVRLLTWCDEPLDALIAARVRRAWEYRQRVLPDTSSCRVVFGEADFLPGLIVDKFEDTLVVQALALGIDRRLDEIVAALVEVLQPRSIYARNDAPVRQLEGLELESRLLYGAEQAQIEIVENGLKMLVDVAGGQKTGYFLDQRDNRRAVRPYSKDAVVLDCFSNVGGFALNAAAGGAREILAVDSSEDALRGLMANAALNGLSDKIMVESGNAFDVLRRLEKEERRFDLVILDPPAFAKNRAALEGATRGYKEINLRAMRILKNGGILVTCSCSFHMNPDLFLATVTDAARDAKKRLRLIENRAQAADHPMLINYPESHYLKCLVLEVSAIC